jgi:hypothetical protein
MCPGLNSQMFADFLQKFTPEYLNKNGIKMLTGYIDHACLTGRTEMDHVTTFALESDSPEQIIAAFNPFPLEIRKVLSWKDSEVKAAGLHSQSTQ